MKWNDTHHVPSVQLPDARIHYVEMGSLPLLVFLHGVGSSSHTWAAQLAFFGKTHHAVAPDMRGYARSAARPKTVSMRAFAADVAALIEQMAAGPAHICGLSMGGIVAQTLWRDRPDLVRSLILADTWANNPLAAATQSERLAEIDSSTMPDLARQRMPGIYGPAAPPELVETGVRVFASLDKACYRAASADLWTQDLRDVARTITVPTLVMVGERDPVTPPALAEELAGLIPDARLSVIPNAGHLVNEENAEAFNQAVAEFLSTA